MDANIKLLIISVALSLASRFFSVMAAATDTKINHIKFDRIIVILVAITGVTGLGVYFIVRRFLPQEVKFVCAKCGKRAPKAKDKCKKCGGTRFSAFSVENRSEMTSKIIACSLIAAVMLAVSYWVNNYSPLAKEIESKYSDFDETYDNAYYDENGDTHI